MFGVAGCGQAVRAGRKGWWVVCRRARYSQSQRASFLSFYPEVAQPREPLSLTSQPQADDPRKPRKPAPWWGLRALHQALGGRSWIWGAPELSCPGGQNLCCLSPTGCLASSSLRKETKTNCWE